MENHFLVAVGEGTDFLRVKKQSKHFCGALVYLPLVKDHSHSLALLFLSIFNCFISNDSKAMANECLF